MTLLASPLAERLLKAEPLAKYTAARLGGPADWLYVARASTDELAAVVEAAWADDLPVRILGGGANALVADSGVRGLVVINRVGAADFDSDQVTVTAGMSLGVLARKCQARGLAGFEWAVSVPGTVGGAVVNNAGAHGGDMAGNVITVTLLDAEAGQQTLTADDLAYAYRTSLLKTRVDRRFAVLSARLRLTPDDPATIQTRMDTFSARRKSTQPPGASLGSIFKNPPGDYAGRLIESVGLKGCSIGGAQVSTVHANFFINTGTASAHDYHALILHVQRTIERTTGIWLEPEIELVGEGF
ncbi:MAG: UDP-N-acetylmuramate dehydrogenase [Chloroflexi bacterium]|nr:UDP-N-acetylmuramate dehydrogenase [Chloroflexota bacterium]